MIETDVVVVGGGQGGLGVGHYLAQSPLEFVVLEEGEPGETWRSQRWDSFRLNTPNWMNGMPGAPYDGDDPWGFMSHHDLANSFERYIEAFALPVHTGTSVTSVSASTGSRRYLVEARRADGDSVAFATDSVVLACGVSRTPRIPAISGDVPGNILQLTTATYRNANTLPEGAVLVVGGGQSGAQIVEDLNSSGRDVYFSISKVARFPRSYRGKDFMDWFVGLGFWDMQTTDVDDPAVLSATNPLVSGVGARGHSISYQHLARNGVRLMGRAERFDGGELVTDDRVREYLEFADEQSEGIRSKIDEYIAENDLDAPEPEPDPGDVCLAAGEEIESLDRLDLREANVNTIIWCTGFKPDFSWVSLPITDESGKPVHERGIAPVPGIYFIGFPWLAKRRSGVVAGIEEDAAFITESLLQELAALA